MLGQPISMLIPEVVGFRLTGRLKEGVTATDLVLTVTQMLRKKGVVEQVRRVLRRRARPPAAGRPGDDRQHGARVRRHLRLLPDRRRDAALPAPDRARRGAHRAGRGLCQGERHVARGRTTTPVYTDTLHARHGRGRAGARRAEAAAGLGAARTWRPSAFYKTVADTATSTARTAAERMGDEGGGDGDRPRQPRCARTAGKVEGEDYTIRDGSVVIAAITSCTNTSNPYVMIGAGLVARKARELGLNRKPWVKTSLAPGSQVVSGLPRGRRAAGGPRRARLQPRRLRLHHLHRQLRAARRPEISKAIADARPRRDRGAVGQPQLRGPDHPGRAGELPRLAAAGGRLRARRRHEHRPDDASRSASSKDGKPVYLKDIWPTERGDRRARRARR